MTSLSWKLNRLRTMGAPEVLWRVRQAAQAQWERIGGARLRAPPADTSAMGTGWTSRLPVGFDAATYRDAAERIMAGRFDIFALKDHPLGFPPQWNRCPKSGTVAPLSFGKLLDYRNERLVGDIKYLWEPSRHAELVTLAQAWHLTRKPRYAEACRSLLDSWFEQCPYPRGVHWASSLEHGVRLVNWAVAWELLESSPIFAGTEEGQAFRRRWLEVIYLHLAFIAGHLSRHSSANNHLLGELMGLFIGCCRWPAWEECAAWRDMAAQQLEEQALLQNAEDGVNREQATWYHHEVADMMVWVGLFGRVRGISFSAAYWQRLERMLDFVAALMDVGGYVPAIGDSDDAKIVRLDPRTGQNVYLSLLATGAVLFQRGDFKRKARELDDKSRWLLGDDASQALRAIPTPAQTETPCAFPAGGYWVLGSDNDMRDEVRIVADAGGLGYLGIAAHGHADALAITLSVAGQPVLVDPGTYAYHTHRKWRDYFRGTSAHNTLRIDGADQSVIGGSFMWLRHARSELLEFDVDSQGQRWAAKHDGYLRLADPVEHTRTLHWHSTTRLLTVTDAVRCESQHRVELHWHVHPACRVERDGVDLNIVWGAGHGVRIALPQGMALEIVEGRTDPPLGWFSDRFDEKRPCKTIILSGQASPGWQAQTAFHCVVRSN